MTLEIPDVGEIKRHLIEAALTDSIMLHGTNSPVRTILHGAEVSLALRFNSPRHSLLDDAFDVEGFVAEDILRKEALG